jgi:hypothetical protein
LGGTAPIAIPFNDLYYKEKNAILEKENERLKAVEQ